MAILSIMATFATPRKCGNRTFCPTISSGCGRRPRLATLRPRPRLLNWGTSVLPGRTASAAGPAASSPSVNAQSCSPARSGCPSAASNVRERDVLATGPTWPTPAPKARMPTGRRWPPSRRNVLPIVRQIQAAGAPTPRAIAAALKARGIRVARRGAWHDAMVRNLLAWDAAR